jgi:hypothetical protein
MRLHHLIASVVTAAMLGGCATQAPLAKTSKPAPSLAEVLAESDRALAANQGERATSLLKGAAAAFPTDKQPWLRLASAALASKQHGAALAHALEALQRDPADRQAHNIVSVSSLNLAAHSLGALGDKSTWSSEAQDMGRQLVASLEPPDDAPACPDAKGERKAGPRKNSTYDDMIRHSVRNTTGR